MMLAKHMPAPLRAPAPSWLLTFADLLGIVLAIFVLIYASSDRDSDELYQAMLQFTDTLPAQQIQTRQSDVSDIMTRQGYQIALLKKQINVMPYWSFEDRGDEALLLQLRGQRLANALGDGTWLEIIERFEAEVSLTVYATDMTVDKETYASAAALLQLRETRGLSSPWLVSVEQGRDEGAVQAEVVLHLGADPVQRHFVELQTSKQGQVRPAEAQ